MNLFKLIKSIKLMPINLLILLLPSSIFAQVNQESKDEPRMRYNCIRVYKTYVYGNEYINEDKDHYVNINVASDFSIYLDSYANKNSRKVDPTKMFRDEENQTYNYNPTYDFSFSIPIKMVKGKGVASSEINYDGSKLSCTRVK